MNSLRARLYAALGVCLVVFSLVLWFAGNRLLEALAQDLVAAQLDDAAAGLLAQLEFDAEGRLVAGSTAPEYDAPFSGHYFVVRADGRELVSRSLWDETLAFSAPSIGEVNFARAGGPQAQPLLLRSAAYLKQGRRIDLAVRRRERTSPPLRPLRLRRPQGGPLDRPRFRRRARLGRG